MTISDTAAAVMGAQVPEAAAAEMAEYFAKSAPPYAAFSRLAHFRNYLRAQGASGSVIDAAKRPEISYIYNESSRNPYVYPGANQPPHWRGGRVVTIPSGMDYSSVLARLEGYDISEPATEPAVIDVMIALSARPCEFMHLEVSGGQVMGYAKARRGEPRPFVSIAPTLLAVSLLEWAQSSIFDGAAPDPGTPRGSRIYRRHLRPMDLALKDLRVLGAEYAALARSTDRTTDAERMAWRRAALRHDPRSVSAAESYSIVLGASVLAKQ
jgi:hypothetical protein